VVVEVDDGDVVVVVVVVVAVVVKKGRKEGRFSDPAVKKGR
jgi:hypothetical protein